MSQTITDINHVVSSFIGWFVLIGFSRGTTIFITDMSRVFCASSVEIGLLYTGTLIGVALGTGLAVPAISKYGNKDSGYLSSGFSVLGYALIAFTGRLTINLPPEFKYAAYAGCILTSHRLLNHLIIRN